MTPLSDRAVVPLVSAPTDDDALRARLAALARGEEAELSALYAEFGDLVFRTARRLTGNREDAEDVTQEVFVKLALAVAGFTGDFTQFPAWLRRIAVRASLMRLRTGRRRREMDTEDVAALVSASDAVLDRLSIEAALQRLSVEHRTVFLLKEVEGYDHREIAELVGISVANSEVRLHRARRHLRELLGGSR
ncbi:MAG TPA: RNA polymerase sigma factor [Gemmatimonadaceae bacterium]|nr:RNA polymerase sigma factor [Gemmatimonadaceae bacterium]